MTNLFSRSVLAIGVSALAMSGAPLQAYSTAKGQAAASVMSPTVAEMAPQGRPRGGGGGAHRPRGGGGGAHRPPSGGGHNARPGGGGGGPSHGRPPARGGANVNINHNNNVNINSNRHYDNGHHGGHDHWDDWDDHWHPVRTAATVAATAAVVGSIVRSVPPNCSTVVVNGISYSQCGSTWYQPQYVGSSVQYVVVNSPR